MNVVLLDGDGIDNSYFDLVAYNNQHPGYSEYNCYNIFIMPTINGGTNTRGAAQITGRNMILNDNYLTANFTICHEMGHSLNLYHTDYRSNGACCENVTRDVNDPNYNALTKGDFVHDTPATPFGFQSGTFANCVWTGTAFDTATPPVQYPNVPLNNLMLSSSCPNIAIFTDLQMARMRA